MSAAKKVFKQIARCAWGTQLTSSANVVSDQTALSVRGCSWHWGRRSHWSDSSDDLLLIVLHLLPPPSKTLIRQRLMPEVHRRLLVEFMCLFYLSIFIYLFWLFPLPGPVVSKYLIVVVLQMFILINAFMSVMQVPGCRFSIPGLIVPSVLFLSVPGYRFLVPGCRFPIPAAGSPNPSYKWLVTGSRAHVADSPFGVSILRKEHSKVNS